MAHLSGVCKYKDCDKPSVADGYCAFHYGIVSKQEDRQISAAMIKVLSAMNERLQSIEEKLSNPQVIIHPESSTKIEKVPVPEKPPLITKKQKPPSSIFIPSVNIASNTIIKDMKTDQTTKDINALAEQLKAAEADK